MRITLAGFNVETAWMKEGGRRGDPTPEVISASYARTTRDPRSIDEIRRDARGQVEKARRSNERIVFGLGHSSIAEHAVFNFDLTGVSRLAVEAVEHFRLASFTEKSQRYIRLGRDIVTPPEVRKARLAKRFVAEAEELHRTYGALLGRIVKSGREESVAREDARYVMPLSTAAQLGMTVNARELEYMVRCLSADRLGEVRAIAAELSRLARAVAPSLVRYPETTTYVRNRHEAREDIGDGMTGSAGEAVADDDRVRLISCTPKGDETLAAALIFASSRCPWKDAAARAALIGPDGRAEIVARTMRGIEPWDPVWREFEAVHLFYETVVSASCFAQLKRHRMATILPQPYDATLGISIPRSIREARGVGEIRKAAARAVRLAGSIARRSPDAAPYAFLNAHRRRVAIGVNLRELYHFSRLRSDRHAQWEIREISDLMCRLASRRLPAGSMLLGGKDVFDERRASLPGAGGGDGG
ncbi:MAG: FAD-dependent thymidylate synthase [Candidatus Krumholzibacteriota bacterium]|nr:FAD-dependent thymidylate synthase [Candidatus Krumholzibacteriota bacterium]